jgi:3-methyl-2-oxobutanoate hydroxymethyltransferase
MSSKINRQSIIKKYHDQQPITMLTCYDSSTASILHETDLDLILVGDSVAMVQHGFPSTVHASLEMMVMHTAAVARAQPKQMIIADLPFLSYRKSLSKCMSAVEALMKAGAEAVKLEGVQGNEGFLQHIIESGVPVMGHLGLTPQHVHQLGGHRVQGKSTDQSKTIAQEAKKLEELGCFALVLECIPKSLALNITRSLCIPTVGIGAGPHTSGQVLVTPDMLGMNQFQPKFLKRFANSRQVILDAVAEFTDQINRREFPSDHESY